jgi:hypothetical protein
MKNFGTFLCIACLTACAGGQAPVSIDEAFGAVDADDASVLRRYLNAGGSPNAISSSGESMLYVATGPHGGASVLRLLLERGADPDVGVGTYTPLMNASSWCWLDGVEILVQAGADVKRRNESAQTALQTMCEAGGNREEVEIYLRSSGL